VSEPTPPSAVRTVNAYLEKAKALFAGLSRPARVLIVSTTTLALLFGAFVLYQRANEPYTALFAQLDREDAATIVAKLKELKVPYRVDGDGSTIEVPESKVRELRLDLASAGLPRGGGVGFESFDKMRLGATDFEQRVLYRRALEGELARTIGTIGAVESARVHLVMPEKSVFITRSEPASASIVLRLRPGRALGPSEVAGVVHLVASAVPALEADGITVVTTEGTMLHRPHKAGTPGDVDDGTGDEDARALSRSYETSIEDRVRGLLEKVVGPGHADVRVTADLDPARIEHMEDHYDPSKTALRSEEQSIERGSGELDDSVAGVPGAESNLPNGSARGSSANRPAPGAGPASSASAAASASGAPVAAPAPALAAGAFRESHTRNFEIDHVSEKRFIASGAVRRLAVAVVLDGTKTDKGLVPRPKEELERLTALVRSAAGIADSRGDSVTVESMPFVPAEEASEAVVQPVAPSKLEIAKRWAPVALGAVLVASFAIAALRWRPQIAAALPPAIAQVISPAPELAAPLAPLLDSGDLRAKAHARALSDPATAALVLRFWLGTSVPESHEVVKG
jgi:flagellar M-ring protein FliF